MLFTISNPIINLMKQLGRIDVSRFGLLRAIFSDNKAEIAVTSSSNHKISNEVRWKNSLSPKGEV
ncbi:hypothetical protein C9J47_19970 [Photobacterium indicum]|uniref:Uncharacterized protein n=1 Tax=Photobacterium indicum TaxID=81447 RepID=A0A2T3L4I5_9GAMM|nr:hypothetical protein C9J47_19970 [Photobacterium indicum]